MWYMPQESGQPIPKPIHVQMVESVVLQKLEPTLFDIVEVWVVLNVMVAFFMPARAPVGGQYSMLPS